MSDNNLIDISAEVESLVKKAEKSDKADDALKFSQAASNAANAMACIRYIQQPPDLQGAPAG